MRKYFHALAATLLATLFITACTPKEYVVKPYNEGINIIPQPVELTETTAGAFTITRNTVFVAEGDTLTGIAKLFADKLMASTGYKLGLVSAPVSSNYIRISVDPSISENHEAYTFNSSEVGIDIVGSTPQGAFYGLQTLLQLLPAEVESSKRVEDVAWTIPAVSIKDYPRYHYRGLLLDACRHFITVEDMKKHIDILSMLKVNKLHWHLTEDQAWRIEIKKYPRLVEVGSVRTEGEGFEYGPFYYTQEEIKDIVAYAAERYVEIIPEIELPGHAMAALVAYPELACFPRDFKVRNIWGVEDDVFCAGKEEVFKFLEDVISEVITLFPSRYFHIGGDECPKTRWKECPLCQARIKAENLKDEHELQSYFITRIGRFLAENNKALIGWDEILEGGLAPSAIVMSWRGEEGGIAATELNHEVIMSPWTTGLYIDAYQGDHNVEPVAIGGYSTLEKVYSYNPASDKIPAEKQHLVLGPQANLWGEYLYDESIRQYYAYPRMFALAEIGWTPVDRKDFQDFSRRVNNTYVRLDMHDVNYHIPLPEQENGSLDRIQFIDRLTIPFKTTRPVKMVYTTDGSEPSEKSTEYTTPLTFNETTTLKIASVLPSGVLSKVRTLTLTKLDDYTAPVEATDSVALASSAVYAQGLKFITHKEDVRKVEDLASHQSANMESGILTSLKDANKSYLVPGTFDFNIFGTVVEGYFLIPEAGVYVFQSEVDKVWINGELVIDNSKEVPRYSRQDVALALGAGLHSIKYEIQAKVQGGWPTLWNDNRVAYKPYNTPKSAPIEDYRVFHKK